MSDRFNFQSEPEAERAVIGALLLSASNGDDKCVPIVFGALDAHDIVDPALRTLFTAARRLHERGEPMDHVVWISEVQGELSREEAATLLQECRESVATTAHVRHHVQLVSDAARQRRLVCAANDGLNAARNAKSGDDVDAAIATLGLAIAEIRNCGTGGADIVCVAGVEPEQVEWLWRGRVAIGKVTLLAGDPGLGKSLLTLDIAARVSRGAAWPDEPSVLQRAGSVILLSAEDDIADTIRPRLDAHEADVSRVHILTSLADLTLDIDQLRSAIDRLPGVRVIIIDPVSAYMGRADSHVNAEVRAVLAPLAELAAEKRVAIIAVTHLRKGEGAAMYRAMGSLAFVAAARAAWVVVRDKTDPKRRLLLSVKNNLAADSDNGLAFGVDSHGLSSAPVVCWERDPVTVTADEALAPEPRKRGPVAEERDDAAEWLRRVLADGPRLAKEVTEEAIHGHSIAKRTLERARKALRVVAYRNKIPGPWLWRRAASEDREGEPHFKEHGGLGGVSENQLFPNESSRKNPRSPSFVNAGSAPPANGYAGLETEWMS